ncbi:MAG: helix-turn-helix transcriptional regulator [Chitinophagaceae bacterium]|nr:helix-turn-helix transcriptional regulator [Chitinophagaceae bacterium]
MKYLRDEIGIQKFGKRVRELRLSKNMTQEDVAWEAGIEPMQLSRIERGVINTSLSHILAIARAIGVKPKELIDF